MKLLTILLVFIASTLTTALTTGNCTIISTYTVKSGDTLSSIAASKNLTLFTLEGVNTQIKNFDSLSLNQTINLPSPSCIIDPCPIISNHTVISGDTLTSIATANNISLAALESVNTQIENPNFLALNSTIHIPDNTCTVSGPPIATANCVESSNATYTVVSGDTLYIIATQKLGITLAALEAANPQVSNFDAIAVGQVLKVPVCGVCVTSGYEAGYTVVAGDTIFIIASQKLNITVRALEADNKQVVDVNAIDVGQILNVPVCGCT